MRDHVMLSEFGPVRTAVRTGDVYADGRRLYLENDKPRTYDHVQGVAVAIRALALRFGLDGEACERAAYCHDIAAIPAPQDMLRHARTTAWPWMPRRNSTRSSFTRDTLR